MKFWRLHRPGYRVLKTVIATTLTLLVCSRFSKMSPVLALMGAYCAMGRTIRESWTGCLNQMVGVLVGSVLGFLLLHVLPDPPALVIGLSLFAVIGLCNLLHVSYAVFLSSVIFISVCSGASQLPDILARVRDVSIGLAFGLAVNIFVHPYANERQVLALLEKLRAHVEEAGYPLFALSAASHTGTRELVLKIAEKLSTLPPVTVYEPEYVPRPPKLDTSAPLNITVDDNTYIVEGPWLERLMANVNFSDYESRMYFDKMLRESGLFARLEEMGIQDGDIVSLYNLEFEYQH